MTRRSRNRIPPFVRLALAWFAALLPLVVTWAYADPFSSRLDEGPHIVRMESLVRGQLLGAPADAPGEARGANLVVTVPGVLAGLQKSWLCYEFRTPGPPRCPEPFAGPPHPVRLETYFGHYPPLYYALAGWPTLVDAGEAGNIGARLASGLAGDAFLALALAIASRRRSAAAVLGVLLAATPGVFFFTSSINPSGLEMTASLALWVALCDLLLGTRAAPRSRDRSTKRVVVPGTASANPAREHGSTQTETRTGRIQPHAKALDRTPLFVAGLSACVLTLTRALSPMWTVSIIATCAVAGGLGRARDLWRSVAVRLWTVLIGACTLAAVAWIVFAHALEEMHYFYFPRTSNWTILHDELHDLPTDLRQMFGLFGLNNVRPPDVLALVWVGIVVLLYLVAMRYAGGLQRMLLCGLAIAPPAVPLLVAVLTGHKYGLIWQGRYTMPFAEGLPVLSAWVIVNRTETRARPAPAKGRASAPRRSPGLQRARARRVARPLPAWLPAAGLAGIVVVLAIQVVCLWWDVRHYTVGSGSPLTALVRTSPLGLPVPVFWAAASAAAAYAVARVATRPPRGERRLRTQNLQRAA